MGATILSFWAATYWQDHPGGQTHFAMLYLLFPQVTATCFFPQTAEIRFSVWFALATAFAEHQMAPDQYALTNWK